MWRDQAALDAHFASDHISAWRAQWSALGIGERNLTLYTVSNETPV
jgi:quinol monooxygenase YgiN